MMTAATLDHADSAALQHSFLAALEASERAPAPYRHWLLRDVLPAAAAEELHGLPLAPPAGQVFNGRRETNNATRYYFNAEGQHRFPAARALAECFQSAPVVDAIARECGAELRDTSLRIEYCLDTDGFWLEPHTDIGVKRFTMLIYLSRGPGAEGWGTDVYDDERRWLKTAPSHFNGGLIFVPGSNTWHGVEPRPIGGVRKSIIINYVAPEWRARHELAFPERPVA